MKRIIVVLLIGSIILFNGCSTSVQFNKVYLNDEDMQLGAKKIQALEISSTSYREGASGANGGNTGGGCGCN